MIKKNFFLNGHKYSIKKNRSILDIVNYFKYNVSLFVLEYNGVICAKKNWSGIFIKNHDKIEIITIVGGG